MIVCERCGKHVCAQGGRYRCQKCGRLVCDSCSNLYVQAPTVPTPMTFTKAMTEQGLQAHELLCRWCGAESVLAENKIKVED